MFQLASSDLGSQFGEFGIPPCPPPCVDVGKNAFVEDNFQEILDSTADEYRKKYKEFKIRNECGMRIGGASGEGSSCNFN
jgi:hypothetical protein